jgi:hypothetical protein
MNRKKMSEVEKLNRNGYANEWKKTKNARLREYIEGFVSTRPRVSRYSLYRCKESRLWLVIAFPFRDPAFQLVYLVMTVIWRGIGN